MTSAHRFADLTLDSAPQPDATGHADRAQGLDLLHVLVESAPNVAKRDYIGDVSVVEDANESMAS
jgi:hypothetical protein